MSSGAESRFKNIAVFCAAANGARPVYAEAAEALARELVSRKIGLVYGGGSVGLMGKVSSAAHEAGGRVLGVIPEDLAPVEVSGAAVGEVRVVRNMHERKAAMAEASDAFIALPGGFGTLEEILEMISWQQLGFSAKPVGLLNIEGYYDSLLAFFDSSLAEGFLRPEARGIVVVRDTPAALIDALEAYELPPSLIAKLREQSAAADRDPKEFM